LIFGVGIDFVEIERIRDALDRHGERFAHRILSTSEYADWTAVSEALRARFLAKRFAAKEAFSKAAGTGIGRGFGFQDLSVEHDALGKPVIQCNVTNRTLAEFSDCQIHLSLTDERSLAGAYCVIERP
jgi:holo-[acyl-carrier protein] synthase